jgi:uncharacterized protein
VKTTLQTLVELQKIDSRILGLQQKMTEFPNLVERLEKQLADHESALAVMEARLDEQDKNRRTKESDVESRVEKIKKYQGQLLEVKTNKEYTALLAEIKGLKTKNSLTEDDILELMEAVDRTKKAIIELQRELQKEKGRAEEVKQVKIVEQTEIQQILTKEQAVRQQVAERLEKKVLKEYSKLLALRNGVAVITVDSEGVCGGCRVALTPQMFAEVKSGAYLHRCPTCFRFLYWSENTSVSE